MMKNYSTKHKLIVVAVGSLLFILVGMFIALRPDLIVQLQDQYVDVSYDRTSKKADYQIVKDLPASWTSLDEVSDHAAWAVVISEDWAFYEHAGVDFLQVQKALRDYIKGERLRGASTLTQQLTKNVFLSHERSLLRKTREMGMAVIMEQTVDKSRILEQYLNIVEFGEGIYGIAMASEFYFNKRPSELKAKEGAFLAMLLPSPKKYAASYEQKRLTEYASKTMEDILHKLNQAKILTDEQLQRELARKLPFIKKAERPAKSKISAKKRNARPSRVESSDFSDGRDFEKQYLNDPDLALAQEPEFDPSQLDEVDLDVEVEFSLE